MTPETLTLLANVVITPTLVLLTMWLKTASSKSERAAKREDGFINDLMKRVDDLEREVKEVRIELKNRDAEYVDLYKQHTTLKAKYEVLLTDHDKLKRDYEATAIELTTLKDDIKRKAEEAAKQMQKL